MTEHVYNLKYWSREEKRPRIDFTLPEHGNIPWSRIGRVLEGEAPVSEYEAVHFVVHKDDALDWHTYRAAGTYGLMSQAAIDLVGPYMTHCFEFVEASINDAPYYFLRSIGTLDCFDRENSAIVLFEPDEPDIMEIYRYSFFKEKISDPIVFQIPDCHGLLASDSIKRIVEEAGLKGFYFVDAEVDTRRGDPVEPTRSVGDCGSVGSWSKGGAKKDKSIIASIEDIERIEQKLSVTLPQFYRDFLLSYPSSLIDTKLDLGWKQEAPADRQLRNDAERIIYWNEYVRFPGVAWTEDDGPWPVRYFVIGDDECGNYWAIELESNDEGVWFYDHERGIFERQHDSLQAFGPRC